MIDDKNPGITLQFPKLHSALFKTKKEMTADDPRKGVIVLNNCAIIFRNNFCLVVDLFKYFTLDCNITDENEISELKKILMFMDGKVFNPEYWTELTKGATMKMKEGHLYVDTPKYSKDLHYKEMDINILEPLNNLKAADKLQENLVSGISIPFGALNTIFETLKSDFKIDNIILQFNAQDKPVKFTFMNRKHFFGYIYPDYNSIQEGFKFDNLSVFISDEFVVDIHKELIEIHKPKLAPPPPKPVEKESDDTDDLFGGDIQSGKSWQRGPGKLVSLDQLPNTGEDE